MQVLGETNCMLALQVPVVYDFILKMKYIIRALLVAWAKPAGDPTVSATHFNRARVRPCQTLRHGYRNTLRFRRHWISRFTDLDGRRPRYRAVWEQGRGYFGSGYRLFQVSNHAQNNIG